MKKAFLITSRIVLISAIFCTLLFAFYQSSLPPVQSNEMSDGVSDTLEQIISSDTKVGEKVHNNIREIAHFSEFFVLGFFVSVYCSFVSVRKIWITKTKLVFILASFVFGTLCACIDESIQIFSSRTPDIYDVMIDSLGYLISASAIYALYFAAFLVFNLILRRKNKHKA